MLPQDHIEVTALRDGDAFIILELVGTGVRDVLGIKVGNALKPSSPVNVLQGGTVQFVTKQVVTGKWVSSNPDVASVDKKTGKVHALSLGSTRISNDDMGSSLNVLKIDGADKSEIFSIKSEDNILAFKLYWRIDGQLQ